MIYHSLNLFRIFFSFPSTFLSILVSSDSQTNHSMLCLFSSFKFLTSNAHLIAAAPTVSVPRPATAFFFFIYICLSYLMHLFIMQIPLKTCEDCGGSGICSECSGEGFVLKKLSEESAERARLSAKNMATRYTAGYILSLSLNLYLWHTHALVRPHMHTHRNSTIFIVGLIQRGTPFQASKEVELLYEVLLCPIL